MQLVRAHPESQHLETACGGDHQSDEQQRARSNGNAPAHVHDRQPRERQRRRREIDDRFPPQREPRIDPRDRLAERQLQVERAVHDERQHHDGQGDDPGVISG